MVSFITEIDTYEVVSILLFYLRSIKSTEKFIVDHLPQYSTPSNGYHHMPKCILVQNSRNAHIQSTFFLLFSHHPATLSWNFPALNKTFTNAKRATIQVIKRQIILTDALK